MNICAVESADGKVSLWVVEVGGSGKNESRALPRPFGLCRAYRRRDQRLPGCRRAALVIIW